MNMMIQKNAGDALLVMVRICEAPAEPIEQRCEALRMDRAREFRARAELDTRGLIKQVKQTIGGKGQILPAYRQGSCLGPEAENSHQEVQIRYRPRVSSVPVGKTYRPDWPKVASSEEQFDSP